MPQLPPSVCPAILSARPCRSVWFSISCVLDEPVAAAAAAGLGIVTAVAVLMQGVTGQPPHSVTAMLTRGGLHGKPRFRPLIQRVPRNDPPAACPPCSHSSLPHATCPKCYCRTSLLCCCAYCTGPRCASRCVFALADRASVCCASGALHR